MYCVLSTFEEHVHVLASCASKIERTRENERGKQSEGGRERDEREKKKEKEKEGEGGLGVWVEKALSRQAQSTHDPDTPVDICTQSRVKIYST